MSTEQKTKRQGRVSRKDMILGYARELKLEDESIKLLDRLIEIAKIKDGVITRFDLAYKDQLTDELFNGDSSQFLYAYKQLVNAKLIHLKILDLVILAWNKYHIKALIHNLPKKKYIRDPHKLQLEIQETVQRFGSIHSKTENKELKIKDIWNIVKGVKIPRIFKPIFTGKFDEDSIKHIKELVKEGNDTFSKEEMRYLLGLIAISRDGDISSPDMPYIIRMLETLFEDNTIAESTCYDVHRKLVAKGVIKEITDSDRKNKYHRKNITILRIVGYKEGFGKGKNYVVIPYVSFSEIFKNMETSAIKYAFDVLFDNNNGEDKNGDIDMEKVTIRRVITTQYSTKSEKEKYTKEVLHWLNRNYPCEVLYLIFGNKSTSKKPTRTPLTAIFVINDHRLEKEGILEFKVKKTYFVRKKEYKQVEENIVARYFKQSKIIDEIIKGLHIRVTLDEFTGFVKVLLEEDKSSMERLLKELEKRILREDELGEVKNRIGYLSWLCREYKAGNLDRNVIESHISKAIENEKEIEEEYHKKILSKIEEA